MSKLALPTITIDGTEWAYWSWVEFTEALDEAWTLDFGGPWDWTSELMRSTYVPGSFRDVQLRIDGELAFSGQMIDAVPETSDKSSTVSVPCYAHCGALLDITGPFGVVPIEFNKATFETIVDKICTSVDVPYKFAASGAAKFDKIKCEADAKLWDFLAEAAALKDLLLGSTNLGELLIHTAPTGGEVVEHFVQGDAPGFSIVRQGDMQKICTELTPLARAKRNRPAKNASITNRLAFTERRRPHNFMADLAQDNPEHAARGELSRMCGSIASYTQVVPSWYTSSGKPWAAGQFVEVHNPAAMIYDPYRFLVRKVKRVYDLPPDGGEPTQHVELELALPGTYSNTPPERWPWQAVVR